MYKEATILQVGCHNDCKSFFAGLEIDDIKVLEATKDIIKVKKGDLVYHEGAYPRGLFCIYSGKIKVFQNGPDGKEQILHLINEGDILGYRAILGNDRFSCSAVALEDCNICFIPKDIFTHLVEHNPKVANHIIQLLSRELKEAENKVTSLAQGSVKERVAQSLLQLSERYGFEEDGQTLAIIITREELAAIAGSTRETVIRMLFEMRDNGIIDLPGKKIRILRNDLLKRTSELHH